MKKNIPIIMLSGYLGSGKTTLMSFLLQHKELEGKRIAVLVNEFGQLPIDGALLPKGEYHLSEINKGSIFCVCVKTDLLKNMESIARDLMPDILLIEATGVAEPRDISALLSTDFLKNIYFASAVITVVDAVNFSKLATILPALSAQVACADILLINKTDLADSFTIEKTECELRKINPAAVIHRSIKSEFPFVIDHLFKIEKTGISDSEISLCTHAPEDVENCELRIEGAVDRKKFYDILDSYRHSILRGKGIVDFGKDKKYVEIVNGTVFSRPSESIKFHQESKTAMSFVLKSLKPEEFISELRTSQK